MFLIYYHHLHLRVYTHTLSTSYFGLPPYNIPPVVQNVSMNKVGTTGAQKAFLAELERLAISPSFGGMHTYGFCNGYFSFSPHDVFVLFFSIDTTT